jgi:MFS family permease
VASTAIGVGGFAGMAVTPLIVAAMGPTGVWWVSAALSAVALLLVAICVKMPPWVLAAAAAAKNAGTPSNTREGYLNRNIWTLTAASIAYYLPTNSLTTFYITFLNKVHGMSLKQAGSISGLMMIGMLVGAPLGGILLARFRRHLRLKLSLIALACVMIVLSATGFLVTGFMIPVWAFLLGLLGMGFMRVICMTSIPGIMEKPELIGVGFGIYMQGNLVAGIIGPPLMGAVVQHSNWTMAGYALVPIIIIGIIFASMTKFAE